MLVIDLHALGIWKAFVESKGRVAVPSIVARESQYYRDDDGSKVAIDLTSAADEGLIDVIEGSVVAISDVTARFATWFVDSLHPGEVEILAILLSTGPEETAVCSSDKAAISAAAMLGFSERCICLEKLLEAKGLGRKVPQHHSADFMDKYLEEGRKRRITGFGLA